MQPSARYTVSRVTAHLRASATLLGRFLRLKVAVRGAEGEEGEVRLEPANAGGGAAR